MSTTRADGTFELLVRRASGWEQPFFELESFRVFTIPGQFDGDAEMEAVVAVTGTQWATSPETRESLLEVVQHVVHDHWDQIGERGLWCKQSFYD